MGLARALWQVFLAWGLVLGTTQAAPVAVAVASNFAAPMKRLAPDFEQRTGHTLAVSLGATGQFAAQIRHGAPFAVLLAADAQTPRALEAEGWAVAGSRVTYARGQLVLWQREAAGPPLNEARLRRGDFKRLALANPKLAPYGAAAMEVLQALQLTDKLGPLLVEGINSTQAYQFVHSGNAELGFIALSQVWEDGRLREGAIWRIPENLYRPILQDAVLLRSGQTHPGARAWLQYLQSEPARAIMRAYGYTH
ncbi:MAG: molybdate ABC transporter substrate-binding protein [Limnohabitans sp.]|nr:molybdate ABC transporter substrate-binding protein [Limnohabitans sp.]